MNAKLRLLRKVFLWIFLLSFLVLFVEYLSFASYAPTPNPPPVYVDPIVTFYVTISSATISLLGFLITTALSFRREKREARDAELSRKQKEIELEKAQLELEQLKKKLGKKKK